MTTATSTWINYKEVLSGSIFAPIETVSAKEFAETFEFLPTTYYVRGSVSVDSEVLEKYKTDLSFVSGKTTTVWLKDPIDYVMFSTREELDALGLFAMEPNTRYVVNGNNRLNSVTAMLAEAKADTIFLDIQTRRLEGQVTPELLYRLQHTSNDTTRPHSALDTIRMICKVFNQKVSEGLTEAQSTKMCESAFNTTAARISQAKLFADENAENFGSVFDLVDKGIVVPDTAILIIQTCNALELDADTFVTALLQNYASDVATGKQISKAKVKTLRKTFERVAEVSVETAESNESPDSDTDEDVNVEECQGEIETSLRALQAVLSEEKEPTPDMADSYRTGSARLLNSLKVLLPIVPNPTEFFNAFSVLLLKAFSGEGEIDALEPAQLAKVSKILGDLATKDLVPIYNYLNPPVQTELLEEFEESDGVVSEPYSEQP